MNRKSVLLLLFLLPVMMIARNPQQKGRLLKPVTSNLTGYDFIHNDYWRMWANYEGQTAHDPHTGAVGGFFSPKRVPVIYLDGIFWGGLLRGVPAESDTPRAGGIGHRIGTEAGGITVVDGQLQVNEASKGLFKVNKNWQSLTDEYLRNELSIWNNVNVEEIPNEWLKSARQRYAEHWKNWPVQWGAPFNDVNDNGIYDPVVDDQGYPQVGQGDYPGIAGADETMFMVVNDLNELRVKAFTGTVPIGLELQITLWDYQTNFLPLASTIFKRYVLINKSNATLDSMYILLFADPDIGDYRDDLVGCDSTLSLGFAYNANLQDAEALKLDVQIPPAVGLALLQGPLIHSPGNTGMFNFKPVPESVNLPMTSFAYTQALGVIGDPPFGVIDFTLQLYNIMRGFAWTNDLKHPTPFLAGSGPKAGLPTKFPLSGDPVNDPTGLHGDVDGQGQNMPPGDRRFYMSSGPFRMKPGDQQEIIAAWIGAQGNNERQGIATIKEFLRIIQRIYENGFQDVDLMPAEPKVRAEAIGQTIVLNWGWDAQSIEEIEQKEKNGYRFEGYNVYQLPDSMAAIDDPRSVKLITFDLNNNVKTIEGLKFDKQEWQLFVRPLQIGRDSGIQRYFVVKRDSIHQKPLFKSSTYYFAVTSYNYNPEFKDYPSLESNYQVIKVTIEGQKPGLRYTAEPEEFIEVQASQETDVICQVKVVDPTLVTDHDYQITFSSLPDSADTLKNNWFWNLRDLTSGQLLLRDKPVLIFEEEKEITTMGNDNEIVDGLLIKVLSPKPNLKAIVQVADAEGPLTEDEYDEVGAPFNGNNVWHDVSSPNDENPFYISAGGGNGEWARIVRSIENANSHDFEIRFTEEGGVFTWWYDADTYGDVPFEAWDVGIGTYDDDSDDVRCLTGGYSGGGTIGTFDFTYTDPYWNYPATDWIYLRIPIANPELYDIYAADVTSGIFNYEWWNLSREVLARIIICDYGGVKTLPTTGTVIRFITTKGPSEDLTFNFKGPGEPIQTQALLEKDVEKINVFPNPYYAASSMEKERFEHFVTFNHLPPHAIIRIFTLNGAQVIKLEKNDPSQFFRWYLMNEKGWRVASGLYIVHIDMPELKKQKVLKLMVVIGE